MHRLGPISFEDYLELVLYDDDVGFYGAGGGAGRGRDFLTSPEVGPLFATVLAAAADSWWDELGRPDPFVVVEAGAGSGTLAAAFLGAHPRCAAALRYVTVERSPTLRAEQRSRLALESPAFVLGASEQSEDTELHPRPGQGPLVTALTELPALAIDGIVLANELLDNLAFVLLERGTDGWLEVRVGEQEGRLIEVLVPAPADLEADAERLAGAAGAGSRIPLQRQAQAWLDAALRVVHQGRVVVIDYCSESAALASRQWSEWLRTYRGHGRGSHPLEAPGAQDVTSEVALDQLGRVSSPTAVRSQAMFLAAHGMGGLADEAADSWRAGAPRGDLAALRARSRVGEAGALSDPSGLGGFTVVEWAVAGRRRRRDPS